MVNQKPACPICGRRPVDRYKPFCSARCQEVDLGRWLGGVYRIPGPPADLDEDPVVSSEIT
ncbi:MAG TPA: DNA gyrase inhibitor YacG [Rhodopila sp.]|jgi:endogenous inhibitor of DNA gyrase (YacG/DUF329 family)|nr:DNA gyrase inhibitor YacG [Rhodopila sp.]